MKTAMQEAIDYLKENNLHGIAYALEKMYISKEKQQIKEAFDKGYKTGLPDYINTERGDYNKKSETSETYYNNTFKK